MTKRQNLQITLLSGLIAIGGTALLAQGTPGNGASSQDRFVQMDTNGDGQLSADEMKAHSAERFGKPTLMATVS